MTEDKIRDFLRNEMRVVRSDRQDAFTDMLKRFVEYQKKQVKKCYTPYVVGRSEQLVCDKCGYPMFYHKPDDIIYCHGCNNTKPAN